MSGTLNAATVNYNNVFSNVTIYNSEQVTSNLVVDGTTSLDSNVIVTGPATFNNNLGIGLNPTYALDVYSSDQTNSRFGSNLYVIGGAIAPSLGFNTYYSNGWYNGSTGPSTYTGILQYYYGNFQFLSTPASTSNGSNINTSLVTICSMSNNGNVGIGTTNPRYTLDVNGSMGIAGTLYANALTGGTLSGCALSNNSLTGALNGVLWSVTDSYGLVYTGAVQQPLRLPSSALLIGSFPGSSNYTPGNVYCAGDVNVNGTMRLNGIVTFNSNISSSMWATGGTTPYTPQQASKFYQSFTGSQLSNSTFTLCNIGDIGTVTVSVFTPAANRCQATWMYNTRNAIGPNGIVYTNLIGGSNTGLITLSIPTSNGGAPIVFSIPGTGIDDYQYATVDATFTSV